MRNAVSPQPSVMMETPPLLINARMDIVGTHPIQAGVTPIPIAMMANYVQMMSVVQTTLAPIPVFRIAVFPTLTATTETSAQRIPAIHRQTRVKVRWMKIAV